MTKSRCKYKGFMLTDRYEILEMKYNSFGDKIFAASIYATNGLYSLQEVADLAGLSRTALHRFMHDKLPDISPGMYEKCKRVARSHYIGRKKLYDIRIVEQSKISKKENQNE